VLGNVHYPHLRQLLRTLEFCLERGVTQPNILRTRARKSFTESLSELHAAEHFLLRTFRVTALDATKGDASVPDLLVSGQAVEMAVEVYCPRQWEGLDDFVDDLKDGLKNLDIGFNYEFRADISQLEHFNGAGELVQLHPVDLAHGLDTTTRAVLVSDLLGELSAKLDDAIPSVTAARDRPDLNLKVSVTLRAIQPSKDPIPLRRGVISPPSISGYAPEAMFDRLVGRRVRAKAAKGQAVGQAPCSLLIVDLSHSQLTRELEHSVYRAQFEQTLRARLGECLLGYDLVAFCDASEWGSGLRLQFLLPEDARHGSILFGNRLH
jgi:hypothetical protein